jgi:branched-chain amino acid transport system substrate-binding protein
MTFGSRNRFSRRQILQGTSALGAGLIGAVLAACGSNNNKNNTNSNSANNASAATKAATVASAASSAATTAPTTVAATTAATSASTSAATSAAATKAATGTPAAKNYKLNSDVGIAFISSFTGSLAPVYAAFVSGAKLAIDEINAAGGVGGVKLNLVQADDQSNPAQVPAAALGVVDKKLSFCIGPIGSNAISASPALNQGKIIQCGYSDNPQLADPSKFPYSFRFVWSAQQSSKLLVDYYMKQLNITKIAVLGENTVYGQTDMPTTQTYMNSVGLKPAVFEYFQSGTADFTPLLQKVQDAGAQGIIWWTQGGPEGISIVKNMNDLKVNIPIAGIGLIAGALKGVVPDSRLDQCFGVTWKNVTYTGDQPTSGKMVDFLAKLDSAGGLGQVGSGGTAPFYDFVYYMKAAIDATGSIDSTQIVKYMESNPYNGVIANYNAITAKDHSTVSDDQISLGVLSSWNSTSANSKVLMKRATGL